MDLAAAVPPIASQQCYVSVSMLGGLFGKKVYQPMVVLSPTPYNTQTPAHHPILMSPAILDKTVPPTARIWCGVATNDGGQPCDYNNGLIGGGFSWWPAMPQILQIDPAQKCAPILQGEGVPRLLVQRGWCPVMEWGRTKGYNAGASSTQETDLSSQKLL